MFTHETSDDSPFRLCRMRQIMTFKCVLSGECLSTNSAREGFLSSMYHHVSLEVPCMREDVTTYFARVEPV